MAVLLTCHNRKNQTLACLDTLKNQNLIDDVKLQVYLVDDGCTDGTGEAIRRHYPKVKVLQGDGNLYWCGGMRMAFAEAMNGDYDYYLWLNDDTKLYSKAINTLLETARKIRKISEHDGIVVGATCDPNTGKQTYGGVAQFSKWRPLGFKFVEPLDEPQRCDTMNGNCVLIPRFIVQRVGNISPEFTHAIGDNDYGLRAKSKGFYCWVSPGFVGTCRSNPNRSQWANLNLTLRERLKILYSPKGLPPREWMLFARRHAGGVWPYYWLTQQLHVFLPKLWGWLGK